MQAPAEQPVLEAPWGSGHAVHRVPQEFVLVSWAHTPLQLCEPVGQLPQAAVASTQAPLQSFCVPVQAPPQAPAVQVGEPLVIAGQGVQDVPQLPGSLLLRHLPTVAQ